MHEMSLVRSLMRQVTQIVADEGGGDVRAIRLQCGSFSGVEPALLISAFERLQTELPNHENEFAQALLHVEEVPLEVQCQRCRAEFQPDCFCFNCRQCGCAEVEVIRGDGILLESIELEPLQGEPV